MEKHSLGFRVNQIYFRRETEEMSGNLNEQNENLLINDHDKMKKVELKTEFINENVIR